MKTFFSFLAIAVLVFAMSNVSAAGNASVPGWGDLTETQKAEIKLQAAKAAEAKVTGPVNPQQVQEWVNVGKSVGVGFAAAAEELGVGVDKLMQSDTGKLAMFLIVWNYIGEQVLGLIMGSLWFLIFVPLTIRMFTRYGTEPEYTKNDNGDIVATNYSLKSDEAGIYFSVLGIIVFAVGFVIMFA